MIQGLHRFSRRYLLADAAPLSNGERWRSVAAGFLGMALVQGVLTVTPGAPESHSLLAPLGASSVILFALPHSPLGQPWSTAGGLVLSALIGLICGLALHPAWLAIAAALALSIWAMALLRCIHPPGGAMAVVFASGAATLIEHGLANLLINTLAILVAGLVVNGMMPGRHWPQGMAEPGAEPEARLRRLGISHADLQQALEEVDGFLDVNEDDLVQVYDRALEHAHDRHEARTCADLMGRDPVRVAFATPLEEAWALLGRPGALPLPVVDRSGRPLGLLATTDFPVRIKVGTQQPLVDRLRRVLPPSRRSHSERPEVAGQIMSAAVVLPETASLAQAARLLTAAAPPAALLVVDGQGKLQGLLTQADLLGAFCHRQALEHARSARGGRSVAELPFGG